MSAPTEAEAALAAKKDAHEKARAALQEKTANAARLRAEAGAGGSTPEELAAADAAVVHAQLAYDGSAAALPALSAAVAAARADEACDDVVAKLPQLGHDVAAALELVAEALVPFIDAAKRYDQFVEVSVDHLRTVATPQEATYAAAAPPVSQPRHGTAPSPYVGAGSEPVTVQPAVASGQRSRYSDPRYGVPSVDGVPLASNSDSKSAGQSSARHLRRHFGIRAPEIARVWRASCIDH